MLRIAFIEEAAPVNFQVEDLPDRGLIPLQNHVFRAISAAADVFCAGTELRLKDAHGGRGCLDGWQQGNIVRPLGLEFLACKPFARRTRKRSPWKTVGDDRVGTQLANSTEHVFIESIDDRRDGNDRGYADDDPQNGKRGPQRVFPQGIESEKDFFAELEHSFFAHAHAQRQRCGARQSFFEGGHEFSLYSERNASTGSSLAALDAGYVPKKSPTLKATISPLITDHNCTELGSANTHAITLATRTPHKTPIAPPITEIVDDSIKN